MIAYPDTSFLCALYRQQVNSREAAQFFAAMPEALQPPPPTGGELHRTLPPKVRHHVGILVSMSSTLSARACQRPAYPGRAWAWTRIT